MRFDHIGVFVSEIEHGRALLSALLPIVRESETIHDPLLKVVVQFLFDPTGICYELVAPNGPNNPVETVLKTPAVAFGGRRVVFLYTPLDFIIELVEETQTPYARD